MQLKTGRRALYLIVRKVFHVNQQLDVFLIVDYKYIHTHVCGNTVNTFFFAYSS